MNCCRYLALITCVAFSYCSAAFAQIAVETPDDCSNAGEFFAVRVDDKSKEVLLAFDKYYSGLSGLRLEVEVHKTLEINGEVLDQNTVRVLSAARPNKLSYKSGRNMIVCDGRELGMYMEHNNKHAVVDAPKEWETILNMRPIEVFAHIPESALLHRRPLDKLFEEIQSVTYSGIVNLHDHECHLLEASAKNHEFRLWIQVGDRPVLRQYARGDAKLWKSNSTPSDYKVQSGETFTVTNWEENPILTDDEFALNAPAGSSKAQSMYEVAGWPDPLARKIVGRDARGVLEAFGKYLTDRQAFYVKAVTQTTKHDRIVGPKTVAKVSVERPNRIAFRCESSGKGITSDGRRVATDQSLLRTFDRAPALLSKLAKHEPWGTVEGHTQIVLFAALVADDPVRAIVDAAGAESLSYIGKGDFHGKACHLLQGRSRKPRELIRIWFDVGDIPLIRGIAFEKHEDEYDNVRIEELWIEEWNTEPVFDANTFALKPRTQS